MKKRKKDFTSRFLAILLVTWFSSVVAAAPVGKVNDDVVVATFPEHFPPYYQLSPEGEPFGFAIEVMSEVARRANLQLEYLPASSWSEAHTFLRNGKADLIPNMGITLDRAEFVEFTRPYQEFAIRVFVSDRSLGIQSSNDLKNFRVGTVQTNVATKLLKSIPFTQYQSSRKVVEALLDKKIDAIVLPDVVVHKISSQLNRATEVFAVGEPLKVIKRAIAISKDKPELHQKIDNALYDYLNSDEFRDTQAAWEELPEQGWPLQHLVIFNVLFFITLCLLIGGTLFRKLRRTSDEQDPSASKIELRAIGIIFVLVIAILLSMGMTLWVLYEAAFEGQKARLVNIAQGRAKLIESIARFDLQKNFALGIGTPQSHEETLRQVREAHENFKGFGLSGEFTFARREGELISFILRQKHSDTIKPNSVSWYAVEAEPMRRALTGRSGTLVGLDYRGVEVLAAHEPVKVLDAGIVAKIDLSEIQLPYIKSGFIALAISQGIIFICYLLFIYLASPILNKLSQAFIRLQAIVKHSSSLIVIKNTKGEVVLSGPKGKEMGDVGLARGESCVTHSDGTDHTYITTLFDLETPEKSALGSCQISVDITKRVKAELELKQYAMAFESTNEGMVITDTDGVIISVNSAFENITGYSREDALGSKPNMVKSGRHDQNFYKNLWQSLKGEGQWSGEIWNRRKNGETFPEWLNISTVRDNKGDAIFYVAVFSDITSLKRTQDELNYLAHHDPLTELPNRLLFKDRLDHALKNAYRDNEMVAVLAIDLDRFKNINDSLGHPAGDELLKTVAERLLGLVRENDTVARMGGDEFTIIAEGFKSFHSVSCLAEKVVHGMIYDINIGKHNVMTSVSLGIAVYPQDGSTHEELLKNADTALYKAKAQGRNNYQFYTEDLSESAFEKLVMESQIARALANQEFAVYYQPQYDIKTDRLVSAEALVRWNHPKFGLVTPDKFVPWFYPDNSDSQLREFWVSLRFFLWL